MIDSRGKTRWVAFATLLCSALVAPGALAAGVVGDLDGDGKFDAADVFAAIDRIRRGDLRPLPLGDVARPCDGRLGPADGQRLLGAWLAATAEISVASRCHREAIGEEIAPPPPPPPVPRTLDDLFLDIARQVPEFGGLYLEQERLRVVLTEPSASVLAVARRAIERVFGRERFDLAQAEAISGRYSFRSLAAWRTGLERLLERGEITRLDVDERRNRLLIGLADAADQERIAAVLLRRGVPAEAVGFVVRPPLRLNADPLTNALREHRRPLVGGLLIETPGSGCTLGFLAERYGTLGLVTASHCIDPMGQVTGAVVYQDGHDFETPGAPQSLDDPIGFELVDPPFGCGGTCRSSDAAFVALDEDETLRLGRIAGSPGHPPPATFYGSYRIAGKANALCGETVRRVGVITGELAGEVTGTCVGVLADTSGEIGAPPVTTVGCQTVYAAPSPNGDSGAPVFRRRTTGVDVDLVGLHWGSHDEEAVYSPIENIEWSLGVLDVVERNLAPRVEIVAPPDGSSLGGGAFPLAQLIAEVHDPERGGSCSACTASWYSGKDGPLGASTWSGGTTALDAVLGGGSGYRAITLTVTDPDGGSAWDTIVLSSGNSAPTVWIDWPSGTTTVYRAVPYSLLGSSFDPESFQALPCSALTWNVSGPSTASFPVSGCLAPVSFESAGTHQLTLTGVDSGGLTGTATRVVHVVEPPGSAPPVVTFLTPAPGAASAPGAFVSITVQVTDPGGDGTLAIAWYLVSPYQQVPGGPVALGSQPIPSGGTRSLWLRPTDHLVPSCGGVPYTIRVVATDPEGHVGSGDLPLYVMWPPC